MSRVEEVIRMYDTYQMNRILPKQKAALTRAEKSGDPQKVLKTVKEAVKQWEMTGWPDCWSRWQVALDKALPWNDRVDIQEL